MDLHQVLKILVAWPEGISESLLRAHGLDSTTLAELIAARFATSKIVRVWEDGKELELKRIRITDKGRRTLEG
jgi:hypothetical protein